MRIRVCLGLPEAFDSALAGALAVAVLAADVFATAVFGDADFISADFTELAFVPVDFTFVTSVLVEVRCIIFAPKDTRRFKLLHRSSVKRQQLRGFNNVMN